MKKILITGGSGFVGKNLLEQLNNQYVLFAPSHRELDLLDELSVCEFIKQNRIDVVIHGAIHVPMFNGIENEMFNDLKMFLNLVKASRPLEKMIYFGSGAEYDKRYHIRNVKEEDIGRSIPDTEYALAKYTMTQVARGSSNIFNIRLFGIFGKYELWYYKYLSNLCCKAICGFPLTIRKDCQFNFIHIDDLHAVIQWMIESNPQFHDYNFCHDQSYRLSELAEMVKSISRKNVEIQLLSNENNLDYTACNKRLHEEVLDWEITSMEHAIMKLYDYYDEHKEIIDVDLLRESK